MQTIWNIEPQNTSSVEELNLTRAISQVLLNRRLCTLDEVHRFLHPSLDQLSDPFLLKGMKRSVDRISKNIRSQKKVLVHGDYDADGVTATAVLSKVFEKVGAPFKVFLPHRIKDGYGVSAQAIHQAAEEGIDLIVTVDCGSSAREEVALARRLGIDFIVIDHHHLQEQTCPEPFAHINPFQSDCTSSFKDFAAVGLALKLGQALVGIKEVEELLDLVAVGTVSDICPLVGENRILVKFGLEQLSNQPNRGLKALAQAAGLRARKFNSGHLGFILGPRINASGRMGSAEAAYRLLMTASDREATSLARALDEENRSRQKVEAQIVREAGQKVEEEFHFKNDRAIVVWQEGWHPGVVGIVASRLVERYWRPAIVMAVDPATGMARGSGRSIRSVNLVEALERCQTHIEEFGGHEQAVGLSVRVEQLGAFRTALNEDLRSSVELEAFCKPIDIDVEVSLAELTPQLLKEHERLEPFGYKNPRPVFLTRALTIRNISVSAPTKWSGWVTDGEFVFEVSWVKPASVVECLQQTSRVDLVYTIFNRQTFGEDRVVLDVKDLKVVG